MPVKRIDGRSIQKLFLQVISSKRSNKKSLSWNEDGKNTFFNCKNEEELRRTLKIILEFYEKFKFEILTMDAAYEENLYALIVSNFLNGEKDLQEKIDGYNLKKELE